MSLIQRVLPEPEISVQKATEKVPGAMVVTFDDGTQVKRYFDGSYRIVRKEAFVVVEDVTNRKANAMLCAQGYVKVYFTPAT